MVRRTLTLALLAGGLAWGEPTGPQVIHGGVNIQTTGPTTLINQTTDRAIINWNGFNIDVHELVRFIQPNQLSVILNRVVGTDPSTILGGLQANGRVFLINPNGVVFGPNSHVDVGGLMATTLNLSDQDFLAGRYHLTQDPNHALASIVNQGELKVGDGGFLLLVAPMVNNQGVIVAKAGQIGLVGSTEATINFDGQGLIEVRVPQAQLTNPGTVVMPAQAVSDVLRQVVNDPGITEAGQLPRAEGLVVQEGQVSGQRVLLNSTQATVVAAGSTTSGQDVRILSNGLASLRGDVRADFVELSGHHFELKGQVTAGTFLLDPANLHITDSDFLSGAPDEVTRGFLEAQSSGTQIDLEADDLVQVDDMLLDQINLAPDVSLHLTSNNGNIVFQDVNDHLFTVGGGSFQFQAPNGSITLGMVTAPGGTISLNAGQKATFNNLNVLDSSHVRSPGNVTVQAGGDIQLGAISAGNARLEAGGGILADPLGNTEISGDEASFVAGDKVGTATDPVLLQLTTVSGLAREFNFSYDGNPATPGLVNGINGLNLRDSSSTSAASAPPPSNNFSSLLQSTAAKVDQVPVFQVNENTSSFYQPPNNVPPPSTGPGPSPGGDLGQPLLDAMAFVNGLPGVRVKSTSQVADRYIMHVQTEDMMPLFEALGQQGWVVHMTGERLDASKGGLAIHGVLTSIGADLEVRPDPGGQSQAFDFGPLLAQLQSGKPVQIQVDQYSLAALLETLGEQGWQARITNDRLDGRRAGQQLHGEIQGSKATLQLGASTQAVQKPGEASDVFSFLALAPGMKKNIQVCDSQKFVYQLGPEGLMPWIEAFAARGYRVRATADHFEAWKGEDRAEGTVSGNRFFLKVGPDSCFVASNDDADLTALLSWLKTAPGVVVSSESRLVDSTRYHLKTNLSKLLTQLNRHGWKVQGNTAQRGFYRLQLKPQGNGVLLTLLRMPK